MAKVSGDRRWVCVGLGAIGTVPVVLLALAVQPVYILGAISMGLAIGLNIYRNYTEEKRRKEDEKFFVKQIKTNLRTMEGYFLNVEEATTHYDEYGSTEDVMRSLKTFYHRNEQEMKDILHQSKLYLPFWSTLTPEKKETVNKIFETFSWLLYDYYPSGLPESIRKTAVTTSRSKLISKKEWVVNATDNILQTTHPQI